MDQKHLVIDAVVHQKIKVRAAKLNMSMKDYVQLLVEENVVLG